MDLPKFLLADNSKFEDAYVLHTEYPRFLLNTTTDEVEWLDDVEGDDEEELENQVQELLDAAFEFFDNEISAYEDEDFAE